MRLIWLENKMMVVLVLITVKHSADGGQKLVKKTDPDKAQDSKKKLEKDKKDNQRINQ